MLNTNARESLQDSRERANWSRLLMPPMQLGDGTILFTLKDAAERVVALPPAPSSRVAASRIIEAALHGGDMAATRAALRMALLKSAPPDRHSAGTGRASDASARPVPCAFG